MAKILVFNQIEKFDKTCIKIYLYMSQRGFPRIGKGGVVLKKL